MKRVFFPLLWILGGLLSGCVTPEPYDYSAFREAKPTSILVLPPTNQSPDVKASYSMLSQVTYPLAESGYYVFPVAVVDETFRQNGLANPEEIHNVPLNKLHEIFGADAVLYIDVEEYGTSYQIISSDTRVTANAELIDAKTGTKLWSGRATASSTEQNTNSGGLIGMLVQAAIEQIAHTLTDKGHEISGITSARLLSAGMPNGILFGPRALHPAY
ncbi:DUF799 domain-containing protein [Oceanimonas sp. MB9]|uniref:DUF799 domain-containing protein n=1 Tax=Oceanimonas sp. MB9 TaxID=2588453 RepID=UPI0013F5D6AE|nr:DUF799 domain-containing protein [Oceanimonas sp. MB9]NHH99440.1 putative lipoprotein [Oceanimonas sp. MB9]